MEITYIYHSAFLVETARCYYLFDYYQGTLPSLNPAKPIFVLASHGHPDHYSPAVFEKLRQLGMQDITAVLSNDISRKHYPESCPVIRVLHSQEYSLPWGTRLQTLLSTDKGVAFLLTCPEGVLYHGGDLNDWNMDITPEQERRQMTGSYRASIRKLKGISIDAACLPLDPGLGDYYACGFLYFLKNVTVKKVYPMHFGEHSQIIDRFLSEYPAFSGVIVHP